MLPRETFLSHSSIDRKFADQLTGILRSHGIPVWYSTTNILGAQQWHDEIGAALKRCDWFIILLSKQSVKSSWVKRELLFALSDNRYENKIIPILMEDCSFEDLSWTLPALQMIDFRNDEDNGFRSLLKVWGLGYKNS